LLASTTSETGTMIFPPITVAFTVETSEPFTLREIVPCAFQGENKLPNAVPFPDDAEPEIFNDLIVKGTADVTLAANKSTVPIHGETVNVPVEVLA
jgi:hypothetical protein